MNDRPLKLRNIAFFAAYSASKVKGDEFVSNRHNGRTYSYYIKENQSQKWYKKISLFFKGFSRIENTNDYVRTGIWRSCKTALQKGKNNFRSYYKAILKNTSESLFERTVGNIIKLEDPKNVVGANTNSTDEKSNSISTNQSITKSVSVESLIKEIFRETKRESYKDIDITQPGKGTKLSGEHKRNIITDNISIESQSSLSNSYGVALTKNKCPYMEDRFTDGTVVIGDQNVPFFSVFDGHGGALAANFSREYIQSAIEEVCASFSSEEMDNEEIQKAFSLIGETLNKKLTAKEKEEYQSKRERLKTIVEEITKQYENVENLTKEEAANLGEKRDANLAEIEEILDALFVEKEASEKLCSILKNRENCSLQALQTEIRESLESIYRVASPNSGTTMSLAIVYKNAVWAINVGDSRIVAVTTSSIEDTSTLIEQLTRDADPSDPYFQKGVKKRGGTLENLGGGLRVGGTLAVTRAIGDAHVEGITAKAKITRFPLVEGKKTTLVIGSDGIFETQSSEEVGKIVQKMKSEEKSDEEIASAIVEEGYNSGSGDNMVAMVLSL